MSELLLDELTKRYSDVIAVDKMNLNVSDGEFVTFVGPSGCGKSTTLEMVAGLTKPSDGKVFIDDDDVTNAPPKDRNIAMVFQNIALFPHMDVYDNISYGLRLRDIDKEEIDSRVNQAVEILQLEGMLDRMPSELSGGQRQRVAIGRALVRNPGVFLMDEPLANLDAKLRVHMRTEIQRIQRELDVTTIYVTHDQEEAMTMSDRIVIMNDGEIQQAAPPLVCYNTPANRFVAGFIGSPSMNFVDGFVTEAGIETEHFTVEADPSSIEADAGDEITLGVRPEDIYFSENTGELDLPTQPVRATTDVLEPMGDEILVYVLLGDGNQESAGEQQVLLSVSPDVDIDEDEPIEIVLDRQNVHLFDAANGEAIQHSLAPTPMEASD